ncbi:MAG: tfdA 3 [Hyphomicrobiales bacterium]|nr:tfdA 3 [Hyphomicrobiales bacterium]
MGIVARPVHPSFAAEIEGVDLKADHGPQVAAAIEAALDTYAVVALRGQNLDDEQQMAFSEQLGELSRALNHGRQPGQQPRLRAELYDISNLDEDGAVLAEEDRRRTWREADKLWHTDRSFVAADTTYSLLTGRVVPPEGADTEFADMRAAWDALPEDMKRRIDGLQAEHSVWYSRALAAKTDFREDELNTFPPVPQPLVRTHPRTGRKSLVLASHAYRILGWPEDEGKGLLAELTAFATQARFVHAHKWTPGDLVIWDNRTTMHRGTSFDDKRWRRDMRRTTVQGPARHAMAAE